MVPSVCDRLHTSEVFVRRLLLKYSQKSLHGYWMLQKCSSLMFPQEREVWLHCIQNQCNSFRNHNNNTAWMAQPWMLRLVQSLYYTELLSIETLHLEPTTCLSLLFTDIQNHGSRASLLDCTPPTWSGHSDRVTSAGRRPAPQLCFSDGLTHWSCRVCTRCTWWKSICCITATFRCHQGSADA